MPDLTTQTPAEIDAVLAKLYAEAQQLQGQRLGYLNAADRHWQRGDVAAANEAEGFAEGLLDQIDNVQRKAFPYEEQFQLRGGWTRAYLVNNSNGHVHSSTRCSTCFADTSFHWVTDLSGKDETEIVELAGERACTVCYPTAPVDVLKRPTRIFTPDEQAAQVVRAEREAKRAAKDAAVVLDPSNPTKVLYKTDRGATNAVASELASMVGYGPTHPSFKEWETTVWTALNALEAKGSIESAKDYYEAALVKARKKTVTEHNKFMKEFGDYYRRMGTLDPAVDQPGYNPVKF